MSDKQISLVLEAIINGADTAPVIAQKTGLSVSKVSVYVGRLRKDGQVKIARGRPCQRYLSTKTA